ncbi:MAG: dockerin type I repeat-containing protein, partial [Ruminococcus sp.]|nr:dockerin type I repeat-containing protein [Ruminococcus sp.]
MKKNIFKKSISALTVFAACTSMASFSVFAEEKVISDKESFVSSYEGNAQTVAQYLIDNSYSIEKATSIMEYYLQGEKELTTKNIKNSAYYNHDEKILDIPHYALVIMTDYLNEKIDFYFESSTTKVLAPDENICKVRFLHDSNLPDINTNLNYSTEDNRKWSYKISISEISKLDDIINSQQPLIAFPINPAVRSSTEYMLNNSIEFDYNLETETNICTFETFALGDTNHDGKVTKSDLALLLKIQAGLDTFKQDYKDGSNHYSGVTNEVASDVNFDGTVDLKDVELINAYLDGTYNLGDPVSEQTEEEKFVSSYEGDAQTVAQYLIDNSYSVEKAASIMEYYLQGEKEIEEKNIKNIAYYNNDTKISAIPHYALIISTEPVEQQGINICLKSTNTIIKLKDENNYRLLLNDFSVDTSLTYTSSNIWEYNISIPNMPKIESKITSQALISIPIEAGARCCVEEDFYKYIDLNYDIKSGNGLYTYETFALGDTNHDGKVTEADLALL